MTGTWSNPIVNSAVVSLAGSENTPFVWRGRLYRLENFKRCESFPGQPATFRFHEDGFRVIDDAADRIVSVPLLNHYFATATVADGRVHVFCGDYEEDRPWWHIRRLVHLSSDDLITWSRPEIALEADEGERVFNNGIARDKHRWVMLYESDDSRYIPFTFKFAVSDDLKRWRKLDGALYGADKYVGGPALYYEGSHYYVTYVHDNGGTWDTRVARSRDLFSWEDAPPDRPVVAPDPEHPTNPAAFPGVYECNASDLEMIEWEGRLLLWWNGGDQRTCGDLKRGEFPGTRRQFLECFFAP